MSDNTPKRTVVTDADDQVDMPPTKRARAESPTKGVPRALKPRTEAEFNTINELFMGAASKRYPEGYHLNKNWALSGTRLVLQDDGKPAQFRSGYLSSITVFHPMEISAGSPYKVTISVSAPFDDVEAATQSVETYADASDLIKMMADLTQVWGRDLREVIADKDLCKTLMGKEAFKTLPKKKSITDLFDEDMTREGGRPAKFSVPVGEKIETVRNAGSDDGEVRMRTFRFSLYMSTRPDASTSGPVEVASDIVDSLPEDTALAAWCKLNPTGRLRCDVFSTPEGPLPLSQLVATTLIKTPKAEFHKLAGVINLGSQSFQFNAKPNLFTTTIFPRAAGICVHAHQGQLRAAHAGLSTEDAAIYDAV